MDSGRRDELDIQHVLEDTAEASVNHLKACYPSHPYTHRSVDLHLGSYLRRNTYSDIPFQTFLRCSFGVTDSDMDDALKNRVRNLATYKTGDYKIKSADFLKAAGSPEAKSYGHLMEMVLTRKYDPLEELTDEQFREFVHQFTTRALCLHILNRTPMV